MEAPIRTAEELRYLILAIQRAGNRVLAAGLRPLGLTPSQGEVIRVLLDYQPLTLSALGELLICEHGNNPSRWSTASSLPDSSGVTPILATGAK